MFAEAIEQITDAESANEICENIKNADHIFDSKLKASYLMKKQCESLGLKFDIKNKKYVAA